MARRITRKQLKQDEFVSVVDSILQWFSGRWKPIAATAALVAVIVGGYALVTLWSTGRAEEATNALDEAVETLEGTPAKGDEAAVEADPDAAVEQLQAVIDTFSRTAQADEARLYMARILLDKGETDAARELLVKVVERRRGDAIGQVAAYDLFQLRIAAGQIDEVAKELEAMVLGEDDRLPRDTALYELGRLYAGQNDLERAREYYQKLVDEFPESGYRQDASSELSRLG